MALILQALHVPVLPLRTGDDKRDLERLYIYLQDLVAYLYSCNEIVIDTGP